MEYVVDIYGLGASLYFMLTGYHPFRGSSALEIHQKKIDGPLPRPSEKNECIHPKLDEIVARCMDPEPELRPQSALELRRVLDPIRKLYPASSGGRRDIRWAPTPTRKRTRS